MIREDLESLSKVIIDAAIKVHREFGSGLLESVFEMCLENELKSKDLKVDLQVRLLVMYKGRKLD